MRISEPHPMPALQGQLRSRIIAGLLEKVWAGK